jgi:hypothetical protein
LTSVAGADWRGWALARIIRSQDNLRDAPSDGSASGGMGTQPSDAVEYDGYFSKPFKVDVFRDFMMQFLR